MALEGDIIENPVSGERITWLKATEETSADLLQWVHGLRPGAHVPRVHVHAKQAERFEVLSGTARVRRGNDLQLLQAGESIVIPPGTAHGLWNDTGEDVLVKTELRPALHTKVFFETSYGLARDGKVGRDGVPNPLRIAVLMRDLREEHYMPGLPIFLQKAGLALLAPFGRLLGYKARYEAYSGPE